VPQLTRVHRKTVIPTRRSLRQPAERSCTLDGATAQQAYPGGAFTAPAPWAAHLALPLSDFGACTEAVARATDEHAEVLARNHGGRMAFEEAKDPE